MEKSALSTSEVNATTGPGISAAIAAWILGFFVFGGGYITMIAYFLLPVAALAGVILSVIDLIKGRKWALLGLVLSLAPVLLILGAITVMSQGPW